MKHNRKQRPFITLQVTALNTIGQAYKPEYLELDNPGNALRHVAVQRMSGVVSINIFDANHRETYRKLRQSLDRPNIQRLICDLGLSVYHIPLSYVDASVVTETAYEYRGVVDFQFEYLDKDFDPANAGTIGIVDCIETAPTYIPDMPSHIGPVT